ncbi:hypothetical protein ACSBR1_009095 [Camellia fascicularis]
MASDEVPLLDPVIVIGVALGADVEAEDALALLPLADRPFDAATYQPRTHILPPNGILRFMGFIPGLEEDTLLREPTEHLSTKASMVIPRRIIGYGTISGPRCWYGRLPAEVHTVVDATSFGSFYFGLIQMRVESVLYGALAKRWWDTTDLFHFSSTGEMTLTPYDFSMLTGLGVGVGGPIPFDLDMAQWRAAQLQLLGAIPDISSQGMVRYSWFYDHFIDNQPATADEIAQYAHGFLMYLLGTTLFANKKNTMGIYLLGALVRLLRVAEYDWGGAILATLYCYMSSVSRRKADLLGGY